jgi:ankyrin repeat protein
LELGRKESLNLDTSYRHQDDISCHQSFKTSRYEEFKDRNPERVHGTCEWVLNHERYQSWCRSPHSDLLWISADPGCGKSVLSKFLIDQELRTEGLRSTCYFFFKDNEEQNDVAIALCAVLHQLFTHKPELLRHATPIWQRNKEKLQQETGELWRILLSAATDPAAGHVVCVLDALDECENQGRERLIGHLKRFHNSSTSAKKFSLKFLVTSRPYVNIKDQWHGITSGIPTIWLAGETMNEDISKEINHVIDAQILEISDKKGLSQDLQESLKMKLKGTNNRTYLWLYLVLEQIRDSLKHTPKTYDRILDTIPSSVEEAYEKILSKSTNKQETQSLLHIMVGAARPLTLREMDVAFSLATQNGYKSYADLDRDGANLETRIRNLCGLFVYVTNSRVQLIHQTAKEFLMQKKSSSLRSLEIRSQSLHEEKPAKELLFERKVYSNAGSQTWSSSIQEENAEKMMASICMQYLLFIDFGGPVEDKEIGDEETEDPVGDEETESVESPEFEFMDYAAVNWTVHFRNAQISEGNLLLLSASALYETSSCRLRIWFSRYWEKLHPYRPQPQVLINLHFAAITGSTAIVQKLLMARHAVNVDTKDGTNQTALHWAVRNGHEAVVRLLLKKGAGIDVRDKKGRTALHWAAGSGHEAVVRLLLEKGAGVDFQDEDGETALYWAAESGHEAVVWLLLEKGAGVDVQGEDGETALYWAAESGREAVVRLLLEKGAGVDVWDRYGETALYLAAENGHEAVLRLLFEKGAGVDVQDGNGRTALYWAARRGHEAVVRLLESYNPAH